jgi:phosphatidylglycerophosphatase A
MGSLVAAILAYPILLLPNGWMVLALGVVVSTVLGTWSATHYMQVHDCGHDPGEVVVDELAGQWLTYTVLHAWLFGITGSTELAVRLLNDEAASPFFLLLGFLLFRLFDIAKPWPISVADWHVKGGFGVMFDDLLAAIPAGTLLFLAYLLAPAANSGAAGM